MWTTANDVLSRWLGTNAPAEASPVLLVLIEDAEDEVLRHYPKIQARIDSGELPINRVHRVISDVVQRAYKMAGDYRAGFSEATGPFSQSSTFAADTPRVIRLTAEEIRLLAPVEQEIYSLNMAPIPRSYTYSVIDGDVWEVL
jgi:hypothetical protein